MSETPNQPRFAPFATMLVGVIVIYVLVSQIGRHTLPGLETAAGNAAVAPAAADAKDAAQDALLAQRERAMVTIGALPRPAAAPAASQPPANSQALANAPVVAAARLAPSPAPAPARRAEPTPVKAVSAPAAGGALALTAAAAPASAPARYYQVRGGDTLFGIARKTYGDGSHWKRIMQANRMASPAALAVGQKLLIPPLAETHTAWNR